MRRGPYFSISAILLLDDDFTSSDPRSIGNLTQSVFSNRAENIYAFIELLKRTRMVRRGTDLVNTSVDTFILRIPTIGVIILICVSKLAMMARCFSIGIQNILRGADTSGILPPLLKALRDTIMG